jgi:hypothetical protein
MQSTTSAMPKPNRYTGAFPPPDVISHYPNWDYALDEEGEDDQDETTIRPEAEQAFITSATAFTAADVTLASGERLVGLAEVGLYGVCGLSVFEDDDWWRVFYHRPSRGWQPFVQEWLPDVERCPSVALDDTRAFPLRLTTRLPRARGARPYSIEIRPDGSSVQS